jgi:Relaxase/Mobilisation nuclease domain
MVVRISQGTSIRGALSYNERKLAKGHAELLMAEGFFQEGSALGFSAKIKRFELLIEKNNNKSTVNTLHISLNFPPEETIAEGKMRQIATDYMQRIGFARQPFLVYRHKDAHHPHFHIVTTNILENGKAISLHRLATRLSNPARKAIEIEYGLIVNCLHIYTLYIAKIYILYIAF